MGNQLGLNEFWRVFYVSNVGNAIAVHIFRNVGPSEPKMESLLCGERHSVVVWGMLVGYEKYD